MRLLKKERNCLDKTKHQQNLHICFLIEFDFVALNLICVMMAIRNVLYVYIAVLHAS